MTAGDAKTNFLRHFIQVFITIALTALVSAYAITSYTSGPLGGEFNKYLMPAEKWGVPHDLKERGIEPLYGDSWNSGWDGQFYYYISNDVFAQKDTISHIDGDSYRYQRIGIPLLAKALSIISLQEWVSPFLYYLTHLLLILLATGVAAYFFNKNGTSPYWVLLWSLGIGTQVTLLNGLPDGAADALLILALFACLKKQYYFYSFAVTFACLAREAYIIFPLIFLATQLYSSRFYSNRLSTLNYISIAIPIVIFTVWHIFIRINFLQTPGEYAHNILGLPFASVYKHLVAGLGGSYPGLPEGFESYRAAIGLCFFIILVLYSFYLVLKNKPYTLLSTGNIFLFSLSTFTMALVLLYICFGDTVIWNFTGYMKAANIFLFLIPFIMILNNKKTDKWVLIFLIPLTFYFAWMGWQLRINQDTINYHKDVVCKHTLFKENQSCLEKFIWRGDQLPGITGKAINGQKIAHDGVDSPGILSFGPYIELPKGKYKVEVMLSGDGNYTGWVDAQGILRLKKPKMEKPEIIIEAVNFTATTSAFSKVITIEEGSIMNFEVRVWYEKGSLVLDSLSIERL